jgi:hypothetical protein
MKRNIALTVVSLLFSALVLVGILAAVSQLPAVIEARGAYLITREAARALSADRALVWLLVSGSLLLNVVLLATVVYLATARRTDDPPPEL